MTTQELMNVLYDLIAQNPTEQWERDEVAKLIDHVDLDNNTINFINSKGKEFSLVLVDNYAPSTEAEHEAEFVAKLCKDCKDYSEDEYREYTLKPLDDGEVLIYCNDILAGSGDTVELAESTIGRMIEQGVKHESELKEDK